MSKQVKTFGGLTEDKSNCRLISGEYYKIGVVNILNSGECYKINGRYYKATTGYIVFDYEAGEYVVKKSTDLIEGIVGISENNELLMGHFSPNEINNATLYIKEHGSVMKYHVLNYKLLKNNKKYREEISTGDFKQINIQTAKKFLTKKVPDQGYKQSLSYDSRNILTDSVMNYNKYYKSTINRKVSKYSPFLQDLTFGLEFETTEGNIPMRFCKKLGLIPLRDGSVNGLEYVTIPLQGEKGVQTVLDSLYHLEERTSTDYSCSLHVHIGNVPRTMEFIIAMYKVLVFVQDEIYEMFPLYKKYNFGYKRKNYTQPFNPLQVYSKMDHKITDKNLVDNFDILYRYLSMGQSYKGRFKSLDEVTSHPSDPQGTSKWQIRSRYHWANLIPLLFGNHETVEFRIHTSTYNPDKVINYLFICATLVNFVKHNTKSILANFDGVVSSYNLPMLLSKEIHYFKEGDKAHELSDALIDYIHSRKQYTKDCNRTSNIHYKEDDINFYTSLNWSDKPKKKGAFKYKSNRPGISFGTPQFVPPPQPRSIRRTTINRVAEEVREDNLEALRRIRREAELHRAQELIRQAEEPSEIHDALHRLFEEDVAPTPINETGRDTFGQLTDSEEQLFDSL